MNRVAIGSFIALVLLSAFFKISTLDRRVLWAEETFSLDILSGRASTQDIDQRVQTLDGQITTAGQIAKLANLEPEASFKKVAQYIYRNDLRHVSVFYFGLFPIAKYLGESTFQLRVLPMLLSLLALLALWWLCREINASLFQRWLALALYSCANVFFFYGQTIREYSMWGLMIFLSHAALLYAVRRETIRSWILYGAILCAALYTFCLTALILPAHLVWFFCQRGKRAYLRFIAAMGGAVALYSPVIAIYLTRGAEVETGNRWKEYPFWSIADYAIRFCSSLGRFFFDSRWESQWNIGLVCGVGIVALLLCELPKILRERKNEFTLLIFAVLPLAVIVAYDVVTSSISISFSRLIIVVAAPLTPLLAITLTQSLGLSKSGPVAWLWNMALIALLTVSLWFAAFSPHLRHMRHVSLPIAAQVATAHDVDLVVTFARKAQRHWVGLARSLPPETKWMVISRNDFFDPSGFDRLLVYKPHPSWIKRQQSQNLQVFKARSFADEHFWLLTR